MAGLPEQNIRIISPDIGGGFGNKVPIYPGYVVATAASLLLGKPVKWVESRTENLISTGFARDYHMEGRTRARRERPDPGDAGIDPVRPGRLLRRRPAHASSRPGCSTSAPAATTYPVAHVSAKGVFTNKAPGGVAYRCSFRVTEASYLVERLVRHGGLRVGDGPGAVPDGATSSAPTSSPTSRPPGSSTTRVTTTPPSTWRWRWSTTRAGGGKTGRAASRGKRIGIGIASFTEVVGAGHSKEYDIAGLKMFDSAELRVHPTGKAILKLGVKSQGQGHETTFAQIVAEELGIPATDIKVQEGDTDNTPYGLGTYASRSTPVGGAATAMVSRKIREKATADRRPSAGGVARRPGVGAGKVLGQGSPTRR